MRVLLGVQVAGLLAEVQGQSEADVLTQHAKSRRLHRGLHRIIRAHANGRISTGDAAKEMRDLRIVDQRWRLPSDQCRAPLSATHDCGCSRFIVVRATEASREPLNMTLVLVGPAAVRREHKENASIIRVVVDGVTTKSGKLLQFVEQLFS